MLVTIITDASFCPDTLAGGYGVWIASNRGRGTFGGPLTGTKDSGEAEAKAACNGLHHAITNGYVMRGDRILIQIDCIPAIDLFTRKRKARHAENEALLWMEKIAKANDLTLQFRHIKGHNNRCTQNRTKAQQKCDDTAGMYMRMERNKIRCAGLKQQIANSKPASAKKVTPVTKQLDEDSVEYWKRKFRQLLVDTTSFRLRNN